jgi:hypothetical protein
MKRPLKYILVRIGGKWEDLDDVVFVYPAVRS